MRGKRIIVVGATGCVGRELLKVLHENSVPLENVSAAASQDSEGSFVAYGESGASIRVQSLEDVDFSKYDIGLFSAGSEVSKKYAPIAAQSNCVVIDNTSFFRMHDDVPLIVPEVNISALGRYDSRIIANPNCSTIQMVVALKPLHDEFSLTEVAVSTYQATSGSGQKGVDELKSQTRQIVLGGTVSTPHHFRKQIAFNLIPQIDDFTDSLYTKEELKVINESRKILDLPNLDITATCVRVPVVVGHALSVLAKFESDVDLNRARRVLENFEGIKFINDPEELVTPIDSASRDDVFVSRLRKHPTLKNVLTFWCVSDNLRKGAALNAVQIAKRLCES